MDKFFSNSVGRHRPVAVAEHASSSVLKRQVTNQGHQKPDVELGAHRALVNNRKRTQFGLSNASAEVKDAKRKKESTSVPVSNGLQKIDLPAIKDKVLIVEGDFVKLNPILRGATEKDN